MDPDHQNIPDIVVSETAHLSAMLGFGALALVLFGGFALVVWHQKRRQRDGIYRKYALPEDQQKTRARRGI